MRAFAFCLLLGSPLLAQTRYARLGDIYGPVEVQLHPSEPWRSALRNTPLLESSRVRTGSGAHAEIELDDGGVLRLAEDSVSEIADYIRLSTGQRITHLSVDHGVAYFSGEATARDALIVSMPSAQVSIRRPSRVRLEAGADSTRVSVIEGEVRFASAVVELTLAEGKMLKLDLARADKFYLLPEIAELESDKWSRARDKVFASSRGRVPGLQYGIEDLDANGEWIDTGDWGMTWKPRVAAGWAPFREGKWQWYEGLGFTWVSAESWGWAPYHYGRWILQPDQGWLWAPGSPRGFRAGDVYWMRGKELMGWGPLAPGEAWSGSGMPALYLKSTTTFAKYTASPELREIDPTGFDSPPREPLVSAAFSLAPGPPRLNQNRVEYVREGERAGLIRLSPAAAPLPSLPVERPRQREPERAPVTRVSPPQPVEPPRRPVAEPVAAPELMPETFYTLPIYTGIIIMNPPEKKPASKQPGKRRGRPEERGEPEDPENSHDGGRRSQ